MGSQRQGARASTLDIDMPRTCCTHLRVLVPVRMLPVRSPGKSPCGGRRGGQCIESFDLSQVAKGGKIAKRWTNNKKSDFAPGPGTVIAGFSVKSCVEPTKNQLLTPVLKPIRGTFYFWFTKLSVLRCFATMAICVKVERLNPLTF